MISFLAANWVWIAAVIVFFALHRAGPGCCGMHGAHNQERRKPGRERGEDETAEGTGRVR